MRFDSSTNLPPPLALSWRMILWGMTLAPALLILGWSLRQARMPKADPTMQGRTEEEARRLKRILKEPHDEPSRLNDDAVRVIADTGESSASPDDNARLDKSILAAIKDNTFGITATEKPAYEAILAKVRNESLEDLQRVAHKDVPFAVLMLEADRYRGEVVTLEGDVRRISPIVAAGDEPQTADSWEAWLFTTDSGLNPYRVILADLPDGILPGDSLNPPPRVRVTGYFFKRYSYATAHDFHTAPLLIAKTLTLLAPPKRISAPSAGHSRKLTILATGILAAVLIIGVVIEIASRRRSRKRAE